MADAEIAGLTEDTTPDSTDIIYAQDAAGDTDKRVPLSALATLYQPVDSDLTAIAALTTTTFGRSLLALADAAAGRTALELGTAATAATGDFDAAGSAAAAQAASQPVDSDLTAIAALTTTAFGRGLLEAANAAALRTTLNVEDGATADQSAAEILAALLTVDGAGSGLDADLLDGQSSAAFATAAALTAHIDDTSDAHDASAISIADAGNDFTATDVEGALAELQADHETDATNLSDHLADASDAHDASAISVADSGGLYTATDVEGALAEVHDYVDDEIVALDELAAGVRTTLDTGTPGFVGVDVDLASGVSGGDTLTGGTGAGEDLTLASTAHATRGTIFLRDAVEFFAEDKTNTGDAGLVGLVVPSSRTITLNNSTALNPGNTVTGMSFGPTILYDLDGNLFLSGSTFVGNAIYTNRNGESRNIYGVYQFYSGPTYRADGAAVAFTGHWGLNDNPTWSVINSGTGTVALVYAVASSAAIGSGITVTDRRGFSFADATGSGTLTNQIAVDIAALSKGSTLNAGIRNASTTVLTPLANTNITATSATIRNDASLVTLTANNSYTLASTPTIADGQNGQVLKIMNVDTADTITLQDQGTLASSNLRLSANTVALGPRDSIELTYSSVVGDWVQTGQVNVL